jgi:hypothetical protein
LAQKGEMNMRLNSDQTEWTVTIKDNGVVIDQFDCVVSHSICGQGYVSVDGVTVEDGDLAVDLAQSSLPYSRQKFAYVKAILEEDEGFCEAVCEQYGEPFVGCAKADYVLVEVA